MTNRPRRILIDLERTRYPHSGLGYYCRCLEKGLRELPAPEISYSFYRENPSKDPSVVNYRHFHKVFNSTMTGFDLVHITHQLQKYFRRPKVTPSVLTLHDLNFIVEPIPEHRRYVFHRIVRRNLDRADAIVCISEFVRQDLRAHQDLFSLKPDCLVEVVHNGIQLLDEDAIAELPTDILPSESYLLCIGVLQEKKQQHLLIEMLRHLPKEIHLVCIYSEAHEDYKKLLLHSVKDAGVQERVHWLHAVSEAEKNTLLYHCLGLVHPSIAEGFGLPPVEAMSLGKPIFLRRATSLPEIGGEEAFYFDSPEPEAMARLILRGLTTYNTDSSLKVRLLQRARMFDYRTMAAGYADIYRQVLDRLCS